jgi:hypothetical protein
MHWPGREEKEREREEKMAFLLKNCSSSISSHLRSKSQVFFLIWFWFLSVFPFFPCLWIHLFIIVQKTQDALSISRRGFHVEPGPREKAVSLSLSLSLSLWPSLIIFQFPLLFCLRVFLVCVFDLVICWYLLV